MKTTSTFCESTTQARMMQSGPEAADGRGVAARPSNVIPSANTMDRLCKNGTRVAPPANNGTKKQTIE